MNFNVSLHFRVLRDTEMEMLEERLGGLGVLFSPDARVELRPD